MNSFLPARRSEGRAERNWLTRLLLVLLFAGALLSGMAGRAAEHIVFVGEYYFRPTNITIAPGDTVTWINEGFQPHDATARDGTFASPLLGNEESFSFTFNSPGVFPYDCLTHIVEYPQQTGTVIVAAANLPPTVSIISPAAGTRYDAPASLTVTASASDPDGSVASVQFFVNGTAAGSAASPPFSVSVNGLVAGAYSLTATATDDQGAATTSAPVTIVVESNAPPVRFTLGTTVSPTGSGTITVDPPQPPEGYVSGTVVSLTAEAASGFAFTNWTGAANSTTNPLLLVMDSAKSVTAQFVPTTAPVFQLTLNVAPANSGGIRVNPAPNGPNGTYLAGTEVTLTATAAVNFAFANWIGAVNSTNSVISFVMNADQSVTANFVESITPAFTLTLATNPPAAGTISVSPAPNAADGRYLSGTVITLTALPLGTNAFTNWTGAVSSSSNRITFTIDGDKAVTANFVPVIPPSYPLTLRATPPEGGLVLATPPLGIDAMFPAGTVVAVAAQPFNGYRFVRWTGDVNSTNNPIVVVMDGPRAVTATFAPLPALDFAQLSGVWSGLLIDESQTNFTTSGMLSVRVSKSGAFRGTATIGGIRNFVAGQFDRFGYAPLVLRRGSLSGSLQIDSKGERITGLLTDGRRLPALRLYRAVAPSNIVELAGDYSGSIGAVEPVIEPGTLTLRISPRGSVRGTVFLGDGTRASLRSFISIDQRIPVFVPLYRQRGAVMGWLDLNASGVSGDWRWFRPGDSRRHDYPDGFAIVVPVNGSRAE